MIKLSGTRFVTGPAKYSALRYKFPHFTATLFSVYSLLNFLLVDLQPERGEFCRFDLSEMFVRHLLVVAAKPCFANAFTLEGEPFWKFHFSLICCSESTHNLREEARE